jgi:CheY-like chemotaxis protein
MTAGIKERTRLAEILLIEDNHGDVILARRAFRDSRTANKLHIATSGEEALALLRPSGGEGRAYAPDLILLDLNLPKLSGQDVLRTLKEDPDLRYIPVVVLSSSRAAQDVVQSYHLHANGYVVKPSDLEQFRDIVGKLEQFWFEVAVLPDPAAARQVFSIGTP